MRRYATAPRSTFEELFEHAQTGTVTLATAEYPPLRTEREGEVTLSIGSTGAMIVHVTPGTCSAEEFRLRLLFETGTCVFSTPTDLWDFWTGPVAEAFGLEGRAVESKPRSDGSHPPANLITDLAAPKATNVAEPDAESEAEAVSAPKPLLNVAALTLQLARVIHAQEPALERVASAVVAQLTKRHPDRPGSVLLIGPTGVGKTATITTLPNALRALGRPAAHLYRVDCGALTDSIHLTRLLGSPPGYSGHSPATPFLDALLQPDCVLLLDEVDRAHSDLHDLLIGLLDSGRLIRPGGATLDVPHAFVAMTTNVASEELADRLSRTPNEDRWAVQRVCAEHLRSSGFAADLVARIGAFAVYEELDAAEPRRRATETAIFALASEYGLDVAEVDPVVVDVVLDIAGDLGTEGLRGLQHAARELLAGAFGGVAGDGPRRRIVIDTGPPLAVRRVAAARRVAGEAPEAG